MAEDLLMEKILEGYFYRIGGTPGTMIVTTGSQGARDFITMSRSLKLSDSIIADNIEVFTHGQYFKLNQIKIQNNGIEKDSQNQN